MDHLLLGRDGEDIAVGYLQRKGMKILERNYRFGKGELDIVCVDGKELVIVEVKTRTSNIHGEPYIAVSRKKQKQIIAIANRYIFSRNIDLDVRFDIVSVILNSGSVSVEHIPNAFGP